MKKIIVMAITVATLAACNSTATGDSTTNTNDTGATTVTTTTPTTNNAAYSFGEGGVIHRDGKVMVYWNEQLTEYNVNVRL